MTKMLRFLAFGALALSGTQAFGDDTVSRATPTKHQLMKECMDRQKTADVTQSKSQLERICKDQLKDQKDYGITPPPPSDPPRDP